MSPLLGLSALFTSFLSAITGMGGGAILLAVMTSFLPIREVVPVHGIAQLFANLSRTVILRKKINTFMLIPFMIGAPLGSYLGVELLSHKINEQYLKLLIGVFILYVVFKPKKFPEIKPPRWVFIIIGICAGCLGILVGSIGPFLAPFFVRGDLDKENVIATKSAMQFFIHALKIPSFLFLDFNYFSHLPIIIVLVVCVFLGTYMGVKVLGKLNQRTFRFIFKLTLFMAAIRLIQSSLVELL